MRLWVLGTGLESRWLSFTEATFIQFLYNARYVRKGGRVYGEDYSGVLICFTFSPIAGFVGWLGWADTGLKRSFFLV